MNLFPGLHTAPVGDNKHHRPPMAEWFIGLVIYSRKWKWQRVDKVYKNFVGEITGAHSHQLSEDDPDPWNGTGLSYTQEYEDA